MVLGLFYYNLFVCNIIIQNMITWSHGHMVTWSHHIFTVRLMKTLYGVLYKERGVLKNEYTAVRT